MLGTLAAVILLLTACTSYQAATIEVDGRAAAVEARSLDDPGLKGFLEAVQGSSVPVWPPELWDFESLTLAAFYFHPSLEVARAGWRTAQAGEITAGARPNPTLSVGPQYALNPASGVTPWLAFADLEIPLETAGKRGHRLAKAERLSLAARLGVQQAAWTVRGRLREAWLGSIHTRRRVALLERQVAVQEQMLQRWERKLEAGAVSQAEVLSPRLARQKSLLELAEAERAAVEARVAVASAIGVPASALDPVRLAEPSPEPPGNASDLTSAGSRRLALTSRADVLGALADYEAADAALRLEVARQYPDLRLGPGYEYDQGENKIGLRLGIELPLLNRNQGPIAEAVARRDQAAARFNAVQLKVLGEVDAAVALAKASAVSWQRFDELVVTQRQRVTRVRHEIEVGAADPLDLLAAEVELTTAELAFEEAGYQRRLARGRLEHAIQQPLRVDVTRAVGPPATAASGR